MSALRERRSRGKVARIESRSGSPAWMPAMSGSPSSSTASWPKRRRTKRRDRLVARVPGAARPDSRSSPMRSLPGQEKRPLRRNGPSRVGIRERACPRAADAGGRGAARRWCAARDWWAPAGRRGRARGTGRGPPASGRGSRPGPASSRNPSAVSVRITPAERGEASSEKRARGRLRSARAAASPAMPPPTTTTSARAQARRGADEVGQRADEGGRGVERLRAPQRDAEPRAPPARPARRCRTGSRCGRRRSRRARRGRAARPAAAARAAPPRAAGPARARACGPRSGRRARSRRAAGALRPRRARWPPPRRRRDRPASITRTGRLWAVKRTVARPRRARRAQLLREGVEQAGMVVPGLHEAHLDARAAAPPSHGLAVLPHAERRVLRRQRDRRPARARRPRRLRDHVRDEGPPVAHARRTPAVPPSARRERGSPGRA